MNLNEQLTNQAYEFDQNYQEQQQSAAAAKEAEESTQQQPEQPKAEEKKEETKGQTNNPFSAEFWMQPVEGHWSTKGPQGVENLEIGAEGENFVTDPKESWEYATAAPAGALDAVIGTYNTFTPGPDIPTLPKYESEGAQFVRDVSSIIIPGTQATRILRGGGAVMAANRSGRVGNLLNSPVAKWMGNNMAALGGGAFGDLVAPVQGQTGTQTLLGSAKEAFPKWMGWVPDNLVVLDGESTDAIRGKQILEGSMFGAGSTLIEGLGKLARGLKGMTQASEYLPSNEKAAAYFAKNKPETFETIEEMVEAGAKKEAEELAELGELNTLKAARNGQDIETTNIFGKDDALFDPAENAIRSTDSMGIVGAAVDNTRIAKNIDSVYGRVRNPMSEAALKFSLEETGTVPKIITQLGKNLEDAGEFAFKTPTGKIVDAKSIDEAANKITAEMLGMSDKDLKKFLGQFTQIREGLPMLNAQGKKGVTGAINTLLKQYGELGNMSNIKALALTEAAFAGQVSDFAMNIRLQNGRVGSFRSMEQMLDRIEFLQDIRGMSNVSREGIQNAQSLWQRLTGAGSLKGDQKYAKDILDQMKSENFNALEAIELVQADTRQFMQSLRKLSVERPNFLKPMATIYELTDGDARSVAVANNYIRNRFGVIKKAFIDGQPEIPSVVMQGFWSTMFNSALMGIKTPFKAGLSNFSTWVYRPATHIIGAYLQGDTATMNRAMYAYGDIMQTVSNGGDYMKQMWRRSSQDPSVLRARDELVYKTSDDMLLAKQLADAEAAQGRDGMSVLYDIMKTQDDLAKSPLLRIGNRAMGAHDSWMQSVNAQMFAKMRAWDEITEGGTKAFREADADKLAEKIYKDMFDENGVIKDRQVLNETQRQTFSQNNPISEGFNDLMGRVPGLKPFFMFTRSPINASTYSASFNPVGLFVDKVKAFDKPFEQMPPDRVKRLLTEQGVDIAKVDPAQEYTRLRNTYKGASALGASFVMMGVYGYLSGNITGRYGLRDRQKQQARVKDQGWKPTRAFGIDYSQIPALSDWVGLTIDILDNAFVMEERDTGELLNAMAMSIGSLFTERSMLGNAEQFQDVLSGKGVQRWASNVIFTSQFKVAGALGTMNQILAPQLKAVEQRLDELLLNRIPGKPGLPDDYDWIDGGIVGFTENPLMRLYNAVSPLPYHERPSEVKQYLMDVQFDAKLGMATRSDGGEYTKGEFAQIKKIMGEDGFFRKEVKKLMKQYPAGQFRADFNTLKNQGTQPSARDVDNLHNKLRMLQEEAKKRAEAQLPELLKKKELEAQERNLRQAATRANDGEAFLRHMEQIPK